MFLFIDSQQTDNIEKRDSKFAIFICFQNNCIIFVFILTYWCWYHWKKNYSLYSSIEIMLLPSGGLDPKNKKRNNKKL